MQKLLGRTEAMARATFDVQIASVACVVPKHKVSQQTIAEEAKRFFPRLESSCGLFANTGIESRYVCESPEWYFESRGWEERTASFQRHAIALLEEATLKAVAEANIRIEDIGLPHKAVPSIKLESGRCWPASSSTPIAINARESIVDDKGRSRNDLTFGVRARLS